MNKSEINLKELNARNVISMELFEFTEWFGNKIGEKDLDVNYDDIDDLPICVYFNERSELNSEKEYEDLLSQIREECVFNYDDLNIIISHLILNEELPLANYEFSIDC